MWNLATKPQNFPIAMDLLPLAEFYFKVSIAFKKWCHLVGMKFLFKSLHMAILSSVVEVAALVILELAIEPRRSLFLFFGKCHICFFEDSIP